MKLSNSFLMKIHQISTLGINREEILKYLLLFARCDWSKTVFDESIKHARARFIFFYRVFFKISFQKRNKRRFSVFDTLIKTLGMSGEHSRSWKPLRFASWFPTLRSCSPDIPRVLIRVSNTENRLLFLKLKFVLL